VDDLTQQLLEWVAERPRTYAESIEAWKTSCPRLSVWDDAIVDGLIRPSAQNGGEPIVELTPTGRKRLPTT
jgi:hypothetical protein